MARRILVVEDSDFTREVATNLLRAGGHEVVGADCGRAAVEAARDARFDLVLMDLELPDTSGTEAAAALREASGAVPVVAMTGHRDEAERQRCREAGFAGYVVKPLRKDTLLGAVERALGSDWEAAALRLGGDRALLARLAGVFVDEAPRLIADVRAALAAEDREALRRAAHTLQGNVGHFDERAAERARRLERPGEDADWTKLRDEFAELEKECGRVLSAVERLASEPGS